MCLDRTYTLILSTHFLRVRSGAQIKMYVWKAGRLERNLSAYAFYKNTYGGLLLNALKSWIWVIFFKHLCWLWHTSVTNFGFLRKICDLCIFLLVMYLLRKEKKIFVSKKISTIPRVVSNVCFKWGTYE